MSQSSSSRSLHAQVCEGEDRLLDCRSKVYRYWGNVNREAVLCVLEDLLLIFRLETESSLCFGAVDGRRLDPSFR